MPDRSDVGWFLGGLATGVLVGKVLDEVHGADDDRPVIEVGGGSLKLVHRKKWKRRNHGNDKAWRSAQQNAKELQIYVARLPSHTLRYAGATVVLVATYSSGSTTLTFQQDTEDGKIVPLLESSEGLTLTSTNGPDDTLVLDKSITAVSLSLDNQPVSNVSLPFTLAMF